MTSPRGSNLKFFVWSGSVLIASAASLASLWPASLAAARQQSASLVQQAAKVSGGEAAVDYRLAIWLDRNNPSAYLGLAQLKIAAGQPGQALALLSRAGEGIAASRLRVRTLIELGRYQEAATAASSLTISGASDDDVVLASLAYALASRPADITALISRVTAPEALQRVLRAQAGYVPLAVELYATGLVQSSSRLLTNLPTSYERNLLLGRIHFARHTSADLSQAADFTSSAAALNPSSLEAHQLLAAIYRAQGNLTAASEQDTLVVKLQGGRP